MKWSQIKRVISLTLSVLMVLALLPTSTLAEDAVPAETSAPAETAPSEKAEPTAPENPAPAEETLPAADEATPTPASTETGASGEATPDPSQDPLQEVIPEGPQTFVVNFVIEGETIWDMQQTVAEGDTVHAPRIPAVPEDEAYAGQVFLYWFARANEAYDFDTPISSNLTLYAKFGLTEEAPAITEEPIVADDDVLFAAFSMAGGILPETTPLWTYTFVVDGSTIDTKIIANGDTLDAPAAPAAPEGQKFIGWYTASNTLFDSFGTQTVTEDGATTLTAKFAPSYYVFFYNQFGSVLKTVEPDASNIVPVLSSSDISLASDQALVGWSLTSGGTTDVGPSVTVNGANINLYPIIKNVIWITFVSNGGNYITPMYIQPNTPLTQAVVNTYVASQNGGSSSITKPGYTFSGWTGFAFGNTPSNHVTLTASWTANTNTPYKLVYWIENADDAGYSFEKTVDKTGTSGATITLTAAETAATNLNASYAAYFNAGTYTAGQTIKGDGSSIVNIYHSSKTYTLTFKNGSTTIYSQSYKYDQNIRSVWDVPAILTMSNQGYVWQSNITGDYYSILLKMPGSDLIMTATL